MFVDDGAEDAFEPDTVVRGAVDSRAEMESVENDLGKSEDIDSHTDQPVKAVVFAGEIAVGYCWPDRMGRCLAESQD